MLVWKASTLEMNPGVDKRIVDEAYENDPESAKAEYGGEFRTDLADFVSRETVDAVTMWDRSELPPEPGVTYSAFVDPSGGVWDSSDLGDRPSRAATRSACSTRCSKVRPPFDPETSSRRNAPPCCAVMAWRRSSATNTPASGRRPGSPSTGSSSSNPPGRSPTFITTSCRS